MMDGKPSKTNPVNMLEAQITDGKTNKKIKMKTIESQTIENG